MNKQVIKAIIKKDLRTIRRSKSLMLTLIIVPIILCVVMPSAFISGILFFDVQSIVGNDLDKMLANFFAEFSNSGVVLDTFKKQLIYVFINYLLASLFLLVPIMAASVTAANSFVGEKERKTLESLLFAPITIRELFVAKIFASFLPSYFISIVSFVMSGISINALCYHLFGSIIFPTTNWVVLITCLLPMILILTILLNMMISSRMHTYQEAQNISGIIILPIIAMVVGQVSGLFLINVTIMIIIAVILLIINTILLVKISKYNDRHILFENQVG